jgi:hypothetical protein
MTSDLKPATFRIDRYILDGLDEVKQRDGVPISEQVRRALVAWLQSKDVLPVKAERKRASTRQRS